MADFDRPECRTFREGHPRPAPLRSGCGGGRSGRDRARGRRAADRHGIDGKGGVTAEWDIVDQDGARQTLRFVSGGTVSDALMPKFWKWRTENDLVVIEFDNGAGGWVHRVGRLIAENRIEGSAESSRKRSWNWTAKRR